MVSNDRKGVARRDEGLCTIDHIPVAVAIRSRTEVYAFTVYCVDQGFGVDQVWVWMVSTKVGLWNTILG